MCLATVLPHMVKKVDITLIVQNQYLRSNYRESNLEEDIDMKNV